jgi:N-acetylneuraminic acid mutarotase
MSRSSLWAFVAIAFALAAGAAAIVLADGGNGADGVTATRADRWTALPSSPLQRTEVGAARVGRFIYVAGGALPPNFETTPQVARYDTRSGSWTLVAPMPLALNHPAVAAGAGRCRGHVYVYGGYTGAGEEVDALQRYDPAGNSWTTLPPSGTPRGAATLATAGCSLYAIGGADGGVPQRLVQVYDIRRGAWRQAPSMRIAREHLASAVIGRRILVLGGRASGGNLDAVEELDTRTGKWRRLASIPTARSGFGAVAVHGIAVVVGGEELTPGGETIQPVQAFDPDTRRWRKLPGMLTPRHGLGVAVLGDRIFAAEGGPMPGAQYSSAMETLRLPARVMPGRRASFPRTSPG